MESVVAMTRALQCSATTASSEGSEVGRSGDTNTSEPWQVQFVDGTDRRQITNHRQLGQQQQRRRPQRHADSQHDMYSVQQHLTCTFKGLLDSCFAHTSTLLTPPTPRKHQTSSKTILSSLLRLRPLPTHTHTHMVSSQTRTTKAKKKSTSLRLRSNLPLTPIPTMPTSNLPPPSPPSAENQEAERVARQGEGQRRWDRN